MALDFANSERYPGKLGGDIEYLDISPETPGGVDDIRETAEDMYADTISEMITDAELDFRRGISYFPTSYFDEVKGLVAEEVMVFSKIFDQVSNLLSVAKTKIESDEEKLSDQDIDEIQSAYDELSAARDRIKEKYSLGGSQKMSVPLYVEADMLVGDSKLGTLQERNEKLATEALVAEKGRISNIWQKALRINVDFEYLYPDMGRRPAEVEQYMRLAQEIATRASTVKERIEEKSSSAEDLLNEARAFSGKAGRQLDELKDALGLYEKTGGKVFQDQVSAFPRDESGRLGSIDVQPAEHLGMQDEIEIVDATTVSQSESLRDSNYKILQARVFEEIDKVPYRTRDERHIAHELLRRYDGAEDVKGAEELSKKLTNFLNTIDKASLETEVVKISDEAQSILSDIETNQVGNEDLIMTARTIYEKVLSLVNKDFSALDAVDQSVEKQATNVRLKQAIENLRRLKTDHQNNIPRNFSPADSLVETVNAPPIEVELREEFEEDSEPEDSLMLSEAEIKAAVEKIEKDSSVFGPIDQAFGWSSPYEKLGSASFGEILDLASLPPLDRRKELEKMNLKYEMFSQWSQKFDEMKKVVPDAESLRFDEVVEAYLMLIDQ